MERPDTPDAAGWFEDSTIRLDQVTVTGNRTAISNTTAGLRFESSDVTRLGDIFDERR